MAAACPLCSLRFITCVPPLTRDPSKSEVTKPLGLPVRLRVSPPLLTLHCALPTRQAGLPHVAVSGRLTLASSPWGLQRMFWLLLARLWERSVTKLLS